MALSGVERSRRYRIKHPGRDAAYRATHLDQQAEASRRHHKAVQEDPVLRRARNDAQLERTRSNARFLGALKTTAGCIDCGYNAHSAALDFDHREPWAFRLGSCGPRLLAAVVIETLKCDVRCANCHRIKTAAAASRRTTTLT